MIRRRAIVFLIASSFLLPASLSHAKQTMEMVDVDHDGKKETQKIYENGALKRIVRDTNGDSKPDEFKEFLKGRDLVMTEKDRNFDGKIDQRMVKEWQMRRLIYGQPPIPGYVTLSKDEDNDFDGKFELHWERSKKSKRS